MEYEAKFPHLRVTLSLEGSLFAGISFFALSCPLTFPRMGRSLGVGAEKKIGRDWYERKGVPSMPMPILVTAQVAHKYRMAPTGNL